MTNTLREGTIFAFEQFGDTDFRASGLRSLAISDWKRVLLVWRTAAMKTHDDCTK